MIYVKALIFSDGSVLNISDVYKNKNIKNINADDFLLRFVERLPLSRNKITYFCRNYTAKERQDMLDFLVESGKLHIKKSGKKTIYSLA